MITLTKTLTMTIVALFIAILVGMWLATASPASPEGEHIMPSMSVDVRLGAAELAICDGQTWPHFSDGCASWIAASSRSNGIDRTISMAMHDVDHGFSIVSKAEPMELATR